MTCIFHPIFSLSYEFGVDWNILNKLNDLIATKFFSGMRLQISDNFKGTFDLGEPQPS